MTFDPRAAFVTRSIEYQPSNGIYDPNLAFEAANNEDFVLSGRDPALGGRLREKAVWVDERKCIVHYFFLPLSFPFPMKPTMALRIFSILPRFVLFCFVL